ncbi:hypothetical protein FQN60_010527, partial [Etheostoma spectabile]
MDEEKMSEWLREIYVKRPDGFFHKSPSLLICDSMRAHLTDAVKNQVKQTNSGLDIIPGGLTKELQPLDIGVNRAFKVKLRAAWEQWMTEGKHTFTKTGRQRPATYATICQWIVDAWAKVSVSTVVRAFTKARIITELPANSNDTDSDNDGFGHFGCVIAQLLNSDTEDEEFKGFADESPTCGLVNYTLKRGVPVALRDVKMPSFFPLGRILESSVKDEQSKVEKPASKLLMSQTSVARTVVEMGLINVPQQGNGYDCGVFTILYACAVNGNNQLGPVDSHKARLWIHSLVEEYEPGLSQRKPMSQEKYDAEMKPVLPKRDKKKYLLWFRLGSRPLFNVFYSIVPKKRLTYG